MQIPPFFYLNQVLISSVSRSKTFLVFIAAQTTLKYFWKQKNVVLNNIYKTRYAICMTILKSVGAVVAGFIVVAGLSTITDMLIGYTGAFPPALTTAMLVFALVYRIIYTVLGGYVTALLAPSNKMTHVWVLAGIGQLGGIAGVIAGWNLSAHWYPIMIAVTAIPAVIFGGWLHTKILRK